MLIHSSEWNRHIPTPVKYKHKRNRIFFSAYFLHIQTFFCCCCCLSCALWIYHKNGRFPECRSHSLQNMSPMDRLCHIFMVHVRPFHKTFNVFKLGIHAKGAGKKCKEKSNKFYAEPFLTEFNLIRPRKKRNNNSRTICWCDNFVVWAPKPAIVWYLLAENVHKAYQCGPLCI